MICIFLDDIHNFTEFLSKIYLVIFCVTVFKYDKKSEMFKVFICWKKKKFKIKRDSPIAARRFRNPSTLRV